MENDLNTKLTLENNRNTSLNSVLNSKINTIVQLTNERTEAYGNYQNELGQKLVLQDKNSKLNKDIDLENYRYRILNDDNDNTRKSIDDLNLRLTDTRNRRIELEGENSVLRDNINTTKDELDLTIQTKLNRFEAHRIESNALNERISSLTTEKVDLTNDNTRLNVDLSASRNNVDVLNSRIDTYHRIGYPYYNYPYYPYSYYRYPYS